MNHRFEFLDGLRGVAAIVVVLLHFLDPIGRNKDLVPHAHLAVDFFFRLSGFVLTHAYGARPGTHLTVGRFCLSRLIRLYPMLLLGLVAGTAVIAVRLWVQAEPRAIWNLLGASLINFFLLPSPLPIAGAPRRSGQPILPDGHCFSNGSPRSHSHGCCASATAG